MSEYNTKETLLKKSIESIIKQSYKNLELIIIDDGSSTDVKRIVDDINDKRIKIIVNKANMGFVYSLNKALNKAKGSYVARMDTDDYSHPDRLKRQKEYLDKHPEIAVVGANVEFYDEKGVWGKSSYPQKIDRDQMLRTSPLAHPTIMARRNILLAEGGYPNYTRCEDYALWIKLFSDGYKLANLDDCLLDYRLSKNDYQKKSLQKRKDFFRMLNEQYRPLLKPTAVEYAQIYIKNLLTCIMPTSIKYRMQRNKIKKQSTKL